MNIIYVFLTESIGNSLNALQGLFFLRCCETSGIFKQNVLSLKNLPNLVFNCHELIFQIVHTIQFIKGARRVINHYSREFSNKK